MVLCSLKNNKYALAFRILTRLLSGERVIVSDDFLDIMIDTKDGNRISTCVNRHRVGIKDVYVAWIGEENRPSDLEYRAFISRPQALMNVPQISDLAIGSI